MLYRIIKRPSWWTSIFTTGLPQFLYYDFDLEHFEVASYTVALRYKKKKKKEEILAIRKESPNFDEEFLVETVRGRGDGI